MQTLLLACCIVAVVAVSSAPAATFPVGPEGFESYADGTPLNSLSNQGWGASSDAVAIRTVTNVADLVRGTNALAIPMGLIASNAVSSLAASNVWVDVYAHASLRMAADMPGSANVDTNMTVELFLDTNGFPVVWNPASNLWLVCTQDYQNTSILNFTSEWERVTLCQNYSNKTVALFLNERLLFTGLPFINTNQTFHERFQADCGVAVTSYIDQVSMSYAPPANWTTDLDNDGMTEAQEIQLYGNTSTRSWRTVTVTTNHGTITPYGPFSIRPGGQTNFVLTADAGYYVADVLTNGAAVGSFPGRYTNSVATYTWANILPDGLSNGTFSATFLPKPQLSLAALVNGTAALSATEVFPGGQVVCTMTGNVAYGVASVLTNGDSAASFAGTPRTASYTLSNIWTNTTLTVNFGYTGLRLVPDDYPTLQAAVSAALTNDTIIVGANVYTNDVTLDRSLTLIATNATLDGALTVAGGTTGTLAGCEGLVVTGGVTVVNGGLLRVNGGSNDVGTLTIQSGGTVQVVNAEAFIANGAAYTGTFTFVNGWDAVLVKQALPFFDAFERYSIGARMNSQCQFGWAASSGGVVVQTNQVQSGRAVGIPAQSVFTGTMATTVASNVWVEFYYQDTNRVPFETATTNQVDPSMAVEAFITTNGYVAVFNPELNGGQWDLCTNDAQGVAVSNLANDAWVRITFNQNYVRGRSAVFMNGRLLRQNLRFINTNLVNSGQFEVDAGYGGPTYVDTYSVRTNWVGVVSDDRDVDAWPDAMEIDLYGNMSQSPGVGSVYSIR